MSDDRAPRHDPDSDMLELEDEAEIDLEAATREALRAVETIHQNAADPAPAAAESDAGAREDVEIQRLQSEIADLRDRSVRTLADFDNFRKRAEREREEIRRYAAAEVLREFLAVLDNLDLALRAGGSADDLKTGVEMILRQFGDLLRRHGVDEVPAQGARFDPSLHEAVARAEDPAVHEPTVSEVLRRGFRAHDRLLRPALVKVLVPPSGGEGGV